MTYQDEINAIVVRIEDNIQTDINPFDYAVVLLEEAWPKQKRFKVRASHTKNKTPFTFWIP